MKKLLLILALFVGSFHFTLNLHAQSYPTISVFIDADRSFVTKAGGEASAISMIRQLIAKTDAIFRSQLGLTLQISGIHTWTTDDAFTRTSASTILASFSQYAEANYRSQYSYDIAHLFLGDGVGGEGGLAYSSSACGDITSSPYAYSLSQPDFSDEYEFNPHLIAHEMGHNLGAEHDAMPSCAVKTIMCEAQIGGRYSDASKSQILSYISSRQGAGCFPSTTKSDPSIAAKLSVKASGRTISYKISGAGDCASLSIVGSPSLVGLDTIFGYLEIGKLTPGALVLGSSKKSLILKGKAKIYLGLRCDGQLAASKVKLNTKKMSGGKSTSSAVLALRSMKSTFKAI